MTTALTRYISQREVWIGRILKIMSSLLLSRCCFSLNLRLGTLLIGVLELSLTSFFLFLMMLMVVHVEDIASMASLDLLEVEEKAYSLDDPGSEFYSNNQRRMHNGQHLVTATIILIYTGIFFLTIHLVSCLMMLYGAIRKCSYILLPWISTVFLSLILSAFALLILIFLFYPQFEVGVYCAVISILFLYQLYAWFVVFSFYRELTRNNCCRDIENIVVSYPLDMTQKYPKINI